MSEQRLQVGVIPAKAGIQGAQKASYLDSRLRGNDMTLDVNTPQIRSIFKWPKAQNPFYPVNPV